MEDNQAKKNQSFVREKIKDKPFNKKRAFIRILVSALCGVIFAGMACLVFALMLPRMQIFVSGIPSNETEIEVSASQTETTENATQSESQESEASEEPDTSKETMSSEEQDTSEAETMTEDTQEPTETGDTQELEQNAGEILFPEYSLTLEDYQALQDELYSIGASVNASIVTITSVVSDKDLFHNTYEAENQESGVIISENNEEYLILTESKVIKDASRISVTFLDDTICDATLKMEDKGTGLAILSVEKAMVDSEKTVATIGNSMSVRGGMIAIALGSPLGTNYSILTGNITSTNNEISIDDHNYSVFTTDIVADKDGSGVLINVAGEIVGIVMQDYSASRAENTLTAVAVSELWPVIEKLCAGEEIPYLGMKVSTVTSKIESAYGIPKGAYIKQVTMDSPAMNAGLQSGDVIVRINGEKVLSDGAYTAALLELQPGDAAKIEVMRKGANDYVSLVCDATIGEWK